MSNLAADLKCLEGLTLVCDCPIQAVCEGDLLAGMVFDAGRPAVSHHASVGRIKRRRATPFCKIVLAAAASASLPTPVGAIIPYMHQDFLERAFQSLFPPCLLQGFRFPLIEDLINSPPFSSFPQWCAHSDLEWDGALNPKLVSALLRDSRWGLCPIERPCPQYSRQTSWHITLPLSRWRQRWTLTFGLRPR